VKCSDCGGPAREMTPKVLKAGSTVREPNEALCPGCSSTRVRLVAELDKMPSNLPDIKAKRMVR
jgi:hypothetical protein